MDKEVLDFMFPIFPKMNDDQKDFFQWERDRCQEIKPVSYKNLSIHKDIKEFIADQDAVIKQCFMNCQKLVVFNNKVKYVEGFLMFGGIIPVAHA